MSDSQQQTRWQRWSSRTLIFLHCRPTLIVVSVLIVVDCLSILGQMMSDLHAMRIRFQLEEENVHLFEKHLKMASANQTSLDMEDISDIMLFLRENMDVVLSDRCSDYCDRQTSSSDYNKQNTENTKLPIFDRNSSTNVTIETKDVSCIKSNPIWIQFNKGAEALYVIGEMGVNLKRLDEHEPHGILEDIDVAREVLFIIGVVIVSIMLLEVMMRTICRGRDFYKRKFEVFDTAIVVAAFVVDYAFLSGQWSDNATDSATILILLLPWRFVRVISSLVTAITNKHQIQIQQLKTAKRTCEERLTHARNLVLQMEKDAQSLALLCKRKGANETDIKSCYCKTTTAAVSTFASTCLLITAPSLSETSFYHQGSRGHLFRKVFEEADDVSCEENNNVLVTSGDVVDSEHPRTLRRAGPRVLNTTPSPPGTRVSVVEQCQGLLSGDEVSLSESSEDYITPRTEKTTRL
ncbi:uncharacterized protein LOC132554160 [Ylistrum balloti]|uniref:uncharacterized protein LOC132554160 n=1 Tax=Ylistrum balloti TaxID=509963 RepID=UPI002905C024|nr:uncharacterized protein LOC132554160 [Ylistrum balloti]